MSERLNETFGIRNSYSFNKIYSIFDLPSSQSNKHNEVKIDTKDNVELPTKFLTPGYEDAANASGAILGVPDEKNSQANSAKVVPKLTQSLVEDKLNSRIGVVASKPPTESENVKVGIGPA